MGGLGTERAIFLKLAKVRLAGRRGSAATNAIVAFLLVAYVAVRNSFLVRGNFDRGFGSEIVDVIEEFLDVRAGVSCCGGRGGSILKSWRFVWVEQTTRVVGGAAR